MATGTVFRAAFWALLAGQWVVRVYCDSVIPGARVTRHLLWRYLIIWVK